MPPHTAMDPPLRKAPTLALALLPVAVLIMLLSASVFLFGDTSSQGPNQIALILAAGVAILVGVHLGYPWRELERGIVRGISLSMGAMLILLVVGALIGTWILAGVVPSMIYYGLQILSPGVFYAAACVICALVSIATGSSWTTASTIGIALVGVATAQNLNLGLTAGAIISGAYFGDKMSPLSDTTNLAPAVAGTELFVHIRPHDVDDVSELRRGARGFCRHRMGEPGARRDRRPGRDPPGARAELRHRAAPHAARRSRARAGVAPHACLPRPAHRSAHRRRVRVRVPAPSGSRVRRRARASAVPRAGEGVLDGAFRRLHSPARATRPSTSSSHGEAWRACSTRSGSSCRR